MSDDNASSRADDERRERAAVMAAMGPAAAARWVLEGFVRVIGWLVMIIFVGGMILQGMCHYTARGPKWEFQIKHVPRVEEMMRDVIRVRQSELLAAPHAGLNAELDARGIRDPQECEVTVLFPDRVSEALRGEADIPLHIRPGAAQGPRIRVRVRFDPAKGRYKITGMETEEQKPAEGAGSGTETREGRAVRRGAG